MISIKYKKDEDLTYHSSSIEINIVSIFDVVIVHEKLLLLVIEKHVIFILEYEMLTKDFCSEIVFN